MITQKEIKIKTTNELRKEFFVRCKDCGKFISIVKEYDGVYLVCDSCNNEVFIKYLSYKNVNKTKHFNATWKKDKENTILIFKKKILPVHSSDLYLEKPITGGDI
ncbi:hypothetical protein [Bacteroides sp.]|uniref:hypothetical protein n=1 Tax=Bacteroides sp. TaxID=29523 RepID=UPI002616C87F|nr:hypothetical protein [Bacteroides sp.]MDD3039555.1 hypothetical protein [Bacteroides sp.]